MREILFRGKRLDNGKWVEGYYVYDESGQITEKPTAYIYHLNRHPCGWDLIHFEIIPETLGQYTGLKDENGKKIFEGDIIRYADELHYNCYIESLENPDDYEGVDYSNIWTIDEVVHGYKFNYPAFDLNRHNFETNGLSELLESGQYFYEVIGNIHDNPELLGGVNNNGC